MNDMSRTKACDGAKSAAGLPSWRDLYLAGFSAAGAARARGVSGVAAGKWSAGFGLSWRTPAAERVDPDTCTQAAHFTDWSVLHAAGMTLAQAAQVAGKSHGAAWHWAKSAGVQWAVDDTETRADVRNAKANAIALGLPRCDDGNIDPKACRALWASVLMSEWRVVFATSREFPRKPSPLRRVVGKHHRIHLDQQDASVARARDYERRKALRWFGSPDFDAVCMFAGIDADFVMMRFRAELAARPDLAVDMEVQA